MGIFVLLGRAGFCEFWFVRRRVSGNAMEILRWEYITLIFGKEFLVFFFERMKTHVRVTAQLKNI